VRRREFLALTVAATQARAQTPGGEVWKKLEFLLGRWSGVSGDKETPQGSGQGEFSFQLELNGTVIVRNNYAEYKNAPRHDDLMVIYLDVPGDPPRAIYFDGEGHVIHYTLTFPSPNAVVFESDGTEAGPRYRLSYWMERAALKGKFEVAPPGGEYKSYMSWTSKKKSRWVIMKHA
jgi:hypothetical protein